MDCLFTPEGKEQFAYPLGVKSTIIELERDIQTARRLLSGPSATLGCQDVLRSFSDIRWDALVCHRTEGAVPRATSRGDVVVS